MCEFVNGVCIVCEAQDPHWCNCLSFCVCLKRNWNIGKISVVSTQFKRGDWFEQTIERAFKTQQAGIKAINHFTNGEDKDESE